MGRTVGKLSMAVAFQPFQDRTFVLEPLPVKCAVRRGQSRSLVEKIGE